VLMATLPGLPMFGHGQVEGFTEKYGMEYRRPRYDEAPNHWLVERHDREVAPLLKRRWLFAESANFLMYDFYQDGGRVDENVFAYSNRNGSERALVVYNNRYGTTRGTIDFSAAYADKAAGQLRQQRLREGLGLSGDSSAILAFRDSLTGIEYLRRARQLGEQGLTIDLHAYQCHVFLDWRELHATTTQPWDQLCDRLSGRGVPSLDDALVNLELQPVHDALRLALDAGVVRLLADLAEHPRTTPDGKDKKLTAERKEFFDLAWRRCDAFLRAAQSAYLTLAAKDNRTVAAQPTSPALLQPVFRERMAAAMRLPIIEAAFARPWTAAARRVLPSPSPQFTATAVWGPLLGWCLLELLAESIDAQSPQQTALDLFDRLRLREPLAQALTTLGFEGEEGWRVAARIKVVLLTEAGVGKAAASDENPSQPESSKSFVTGHDFSRAATASTLTGALAPAAPNAGQTSNEAASSADPDSEPALYQGTTSAVPEQESVEPGALAPADSQASASQATSGLVPSLWLDPDVRWLTGAHEAGGHSYLVREPYEELLWWMQMPSLLRLAGEPALDRKAIIQMGNCVDEALASAEAAGYRIDTLLGIAPPEAPVEKPAAPEAELLRAAKSKAAVPEIDAESESAPDPPEPE